MAKAVHKVETDWREQLGASVSRCFALAGLSQKEAAALIGRDTAQIARWVNGQERPQFDAIFAVAQLRQPLVVALAELGGAGVEVTTSITIRRSA